MTASFERCGVMLNGCDMVVLTAGASDPLVYSHGHFKVCVPFHPGVGESGDAPPLSSIRDYNPHYLDVDVFDALGIVYLTLVAHDVGGWLVAVFAGGRNNRVRRPVLAGPFGHARSGALLR